MLLKIASHSSERRRILRIILIAAFILLAAQPVKGHGYLVRSIPEDRAVLERAPVRLQYWFSEALEPDFSSITTRDLNGEVVATGGVSPTNPTLMEARLPTDLEDGAYINELRVAFAADGHVIIESRVFFVGEVVSGVAGLAATDRAIALEVVWKVLVLSSLTLLMGTFALYNLVLLPAWGSATHRAGNLPPRVMRRLNTIVIAALIIAVLGNLLALLQQTMVFFGADAARVLRDGLWQVVRIGTRFGDTWNVRMLLLGLAAVLHGLSLYLRSSQPETVRAFWAANVWVLALMFATLSVASHAAGSLLLPWVAITSDWLHGVAAAIWVGGAVALALVAPAALQPYEGDARRRALLAALNRFSPVAAACLFIVIATGLYNASNWVTQPADMATTYGGALALKVLLVLVLVAIGALHHIALRPARYARFSALIDRVSSFLPTLRLEALTALSVLVAAAYLSATPVPPLDLAGQSIPPPRAEFQLGDYSVAFTMIPGGPGVNTYDAVVLRDGQPANDLTVRLRMAHPPLDWRGDWQIAEPLGDGLFTAAGAEIDRPGPWQTLLEFGDGETMQRAAFQWDISADAAAIQSRDPTLINLILLGGVLAAVGYALYPLLRRFVRALDLSPTIVLVAVAALVLTVVLVVVGIRLTEEAALQYERTVNPPPAVVNPVLPDMASLLRGRAALVEACGDWHTEADWPELLRRLPRTRDEELFAYTSAGWRGLPACSPALDDGSRWDIVNYVRSFEASGAAPLASS